MRPAAAASLRSWANERSLAGTLSYAVAAILALIYVYAALVFLVIIPIYFIIPNLLARNAPQANE